MSILYVTRLKCKTCKRVLRRKQRKHAYSNILKILLPKNGNFSDKKSHILHFKNIDCGYSLEPPRRGGSNAYPQSMFWSRSKKNNVDPCKPQLYYIKVGLKGSNLYRHVFVILVWVSVQSDQCLLCLLILRLVNGQRRPCSDCANAQSDRAFVFCSKRVYFPRRTLNVNDAHDRIPIVLI